MARRISPLRDFLSNESSSGIFLLGAALLGLIAANSPLADSYFEILELQFTIDLPGLYLSLTTLKVINYCLMSIFFFVVGLEIKRELTSGHLAKLRQAAAPLFAALGGMALPALCYLIIAGDEAPQGWAVPVATDIALAVGVLALLGSRVTQGMRTFLLALAVIDDIGAILIIALIYSSGIHFSWLAAALGSVILVLLLKRLSVQSTFPYVLVGVTLWYCLYRTGIHPTLAGVIMGLLTPSREVLSNDEIDIEDGQLTLVERLQNRIHPFSSFAVVPVFAFANSGIPVSATTIEAALSSSIAWGILVGLVIGKPVGIFFTSLLVSRLRIAELPEGASKPALFATGSAAGIGFTVAIFIARLAFDDAASQELAIMAVMIGSLVSGLICAILFRANRSINLD
jgi:NhaA family Na+:H+ antiporter